VATALPKEALANSLTASTQVSTNAPDGIPVEPALEGGPRFGDLAPIVGQYERQGYEFAQHRRMVSLRLQDGRHVTVPVNETLIHYVGNHAY
jgi:hypothetical protein